MVPQNYGLFVAGTVLLIATPGPDMAYLVARCVAQGRSAGFVAALGFNLGSYCHLVAMVAGLSSLIIASPLLFTGLKWFGAAYIAYLGCMALFSKQRRVLFPGDSAEHRRLRVVFWQAFASDILNPKVSLFFLAFLPQFVNPAYPHRISQLFTVCTISIVLYIPLVLLASRLSSGLRSSSAAADYLTKAMGAVFIAIAVQLLVH